MKNLVSTILIMMFMSPLLAQPNPSILLTTASLGYPYTHSFRITLKFSEPVTGFSLTEINVVNATLSNLEGKSNIYYTVTVTPTLPGPITIFVPANMVKSLTTGAPNQVSNKLKIIALNPALNPSSNFDLSLWTLILPLPLGDNSGAITIGNNTLVGHPTLNTGYS